MIPLQIKLRNFLSYGSELQTIDFQAHHLTCLTGKNGHGKSALLDALTWGLWGQARKTSGTSRADQGLLRLGQSNMAVIIEFLSNENRYRVKREYVAGKNKAQVYLEFGIIDPDTEFVRPLTEKTVRTTQNIINKSIGLDYETFINSAYIRQGQSNEFSTKTPKERKDILGNILGLDQFDRVRQCILEETRTIASKKDQLKKLLEHIQEELKNENTVKEDLQQFQIEMIETDNQEKKLSTSLQRLIKSREHLQTQQHTYSILQIEYEHLLKQLQNYESEFKETVITWRKVHHQGINLQNKQDLLKKKRDLEEQLSHLHKQQQERIVTNEELFALKERIQSLEYNQEKDFAEKLHTYELNAETLKNKFDFLKKQIQETEKDISSLTEEINATTTVDSPIDQHKIITMEKSYQGRRSTYDRLTARHDHIKKELERTRKRGLLVTKSSCPLCEQPLSESHKISLHEKLAKHISLFEHQYHRLSKILERTSTLLQHERGNLTSLHEKYTQQTKQIERAEKLHELIKQNEIQINECNAIDEKIKQAMQQKLSIIEKQKNWRKEHNEYQNLHKKITELTTKIASKSLVNEQSTVMKLYHSITHQLDEYELLFDELKQQPSRKSKIHMLCLLMREVKLKLHSLKEKLQKLIDCSLQLEQVTREIQLIEHELYTFNTIKSQLLEKKGRINQLMQHYDKKKKEAETMCIDIKNLEKKLKDYQHIATAFGKDGIQALLIEEALPEIEDEANQLLAKLTDNTQQIFIDSLRDLKSGGTKETLDIKISDEVGIRAYELFSGGEAFRIDFALRIAISKLLARRAGASIQTLIIDEGFGSQDEEGLSHIMDALHKIQDHFAKVIIVSHLPLMQHQFPSHFHITKGPTGSRVSIIQQG